MAVMFNELILMKLIGYQPSMVINIYSLKFVPMKHSLTVEVTENSKSKGKRFLFAGI